MHSIASRMHGVDMLAARTKRYVLSYLTLAVTLRFASGNNRGYIVYV